MARHLLFQQVTCNFRGKSQFTDIKLQTCFQAIGPFPVATPTSLIFRIKSAQSVPLPTDPIPREKKLLDQQRRKLISSVVTICKATNLQDGKLKVVIEILPLYVSFPD